MCSRMELDLYLSSCTKLMPNGPRTLTYDLIDTLNLIKKKVEWALELLGMEKHFLKRTSVALSLRPTIDK